MTVALTPKSLISFSEWEKYEKCAKAQVQFISEPVDLNLYVMYLN